MKSEKLSLYWPGAYAAEVSLPPADYVATPHVGEVGTATWRAACDLIDAWQPASSLKILPSWQEPCASFLATHASTRSVLRVPHVGRARHDARGEAAAARWLGDSERRLGPACAALDESSGAHLLAEHGAWLPSGGGSNTAQRRSLDRSDNAGGAIGRTAATDDGRAHAIVHPETRAALALIQRLHHATPHALPPPGPPSMIDAVLPSRDVQDAAPTWDRDYCHQVLQLDQVLAATSAHLAAAAPPPVPIHGNFAAANIAIDAAGTLRLLGPRHLRLGDPTCDLASWALWQDVPPQALDPLLATYAELDGPHTPPPDATIDRLRVAHCHGLLRRHVLAAAGTAHRAIAQHAGWRLQCALPFVRAAVRDATGLTLA